MRPADIAQPLNNTSYSYRGARFVSKNTNGSLYLVIPFPRLSGVGGDPASAQKGVLL